MQHLDEVGDRVECRHEPQHRARVVDEEEDGGQPYQYPADDRHLMAHVVGDHVQGGDQEGASEAHREHQEECDGQEEHRRYAEMMAVDDRDGDQDGEGQEQHYELLDHVGEDLYPSGHGGLGDVVLVVVEDAPLDRTEEGGHREHAYREIVPEIDLGVERLDLGEHQPDGHGEQYGGDEVPLDPDEAVLVSPLEIPLDHGLEGEPVRPQLFYR